MHKLAGIPLRVSALTSFVKNLTFSLERVVDVVSIPSVGFVYRGTSISQGTITANRNRQHQGCRICLDHGMLHTRDLEMSIDPATQNIFLAIVRNLIYKIYRTRCRRGKFWKFGTIMSTVARVSSLAKEIFINFPFRRGSPIEVLFFGIPSCIKYWRYCPFIPPLL